MDNKSNIRIEIIDFDNTKKKAKETIKNCETKLKLYKGMLWLISIAFIVNLIFIGFQTIQSEPNKDLLVVAITMLIVVIVIIMAVYIKYVTILGKYKESLIVNTIKNNESTSNIKIYRNKSEKDVDKFLTTDPLFIDIDGNRINNIKCEWTETTDKSSGIIKLDLVNNKIICDIITYNQIDLYEQN